jgi:hypothetical protein
MVLPSGQKLTLGILATMNLEVVPFCAYALFPALLPFFKIHPGSHDLWKCSASLAILP